MNRFTRFVLVVICLMAIWVAAKSITVTPHAVAVPDSLNFSAIAMYVQEVLRNPTSTDVNALIEIFFVLSILLLVATSSGANAVQKIRPDNAISSAREYINETLPILEGLERAHEKATPLKTQLEDMQKRLVILGARGSGLLDVHRVTDELVDDVKARIEMLESDSEGNDIAELVRNVSESAKEYGRRVDVVDQVASSLSVVRASVEMVRARVDSLSNPQTGVLANLRIVNDAIEPLEGENGVIATIASGDPRYEGTLDEQIEEARQSVSKLTAALDAVSRSHEVAQSARRQLAHVLHKGNE